MGQDGTVNLPEEIAALKERYNALIERLDTAEERNGERFADLNGRLSVMTDLLQSHALINERRTTHGQGLDRAFESISTLKREAVETGRTMSRWQGVAIGMGICGALIATAFGVAGTSILDGLRDDVKENDAQVEALDARVDRLEQQDMRYHGKY